MNSFGVLNSIAHAKGQWVYHVEWIPKYRYHLFRKESNRKDMIEIIHGIALEKGLKLLELSVMEEHVHAVVEVPPKISLSTATQYLKGKSSYLFFRKHPNMRLRYPKGHLWSPGKFYRTVGDVDLEHMRTYVREQGDAFQQTLNGYS